MTSEGGVPLAAERPERHALVSPLASRLVPLLARLSPPWPFSHFSQSQRGPFWRRREGPLAHSPSPSPSSTHAKVDVLFRLSFLLQSGHGEDKRVETSTSKC